jgi:uncharacterized membrane protein
MERRRFTREFELEAVRLIRDRGVSYAQASEDLKVHPTQLRTEEHRHTRAAERIVQQSVAPCHNRSVVQMALLRFARIDRRPLYSLLLAFAASCFIGTLATDLAYWRTADVGWANFSDWLVTVGVVVGYAALVVAVIEVFIFRQRRSHRPNLLFAMGMIVALILATLNMLVHTRDAWTSIVPWGVVLSASVVFIALVVSWTTHDPNHETFENAKSYEPANPKVSG